jgi:hypothetical protein
MEEGAGDHSSTDPVVRADMRDLFTAVLHLGTFVEEYDVAADVVAKVFRRDEQWRDALTRVRQLLKKYHAHEHLPARRSLAKWRVLRDKLLPMLRLYHADR